MIMRLTQNVFAIDGNVFRFVMERRYECLYLDIQSNPTALPGEFVSQYWADIGSIVIPDDFDFDHFVNSFWRELRQGRPVDILSIVKEVAGKETEEVESHVR